MLAQSSYARLLGLRGDLQIDFIESAALHGNPLGDLSERPVIAYLPPGYDAAGLKRYPVLYCLHGFTGNGAAAISSRPWETNVAQWADQLIAEGKMQPAIVVVVDGFTRLGGSQYVNSIHNGDYATYTTRDVIEHVDATYRTIACEGGRAVLGKSSGGFGALHLAMEYPGTFAAFASHSGDAYFRYAYPPTFMQAQRTLEKYDFDMRAFVEDFERKQKHSQEEHEAICLLGYAAAYSPKSATAFDLDLPFDRASGAMREDVFARWLQYDPVERIAGKADALARLRLRFVDCGRRDEHGLEVGARLVAEAIRGLGLSVRHEEFDDGHRNIGYRYATSLPALVAALDTE